MSLQPVARLGDPGSHGGQMVTGSPYATVDGLPICRVGDFYDCPIPGHGTNPLMAGSAYLTCDGGTPVSRVNEDLTACGAVIMGGSPTLKAS
jgi:uncharacterized Zn-binding protein involved in type VI secretion